MGRPVIIDTDGGVDDACALWWALTDPTLDVVAITVVWGNVAVEVAAGAVLRVVAAAGRTDVPVALGTTGPIGPAPDLRPASFIHGDDGLGNVAGPLPAGVDPVDEAAVDLLVRVTSERPGEVSVVSIGPLSNLGLAVEAHPGWAATVDELVVMGGSVARGGNALPLGEANVAHDPLAAAAVVGAEWRRPPLLVGLDVTYVATLSEAEFDLLALHRSEAAAFLDGPLGFYRVFGSTFTAPDTPCHDLLAVMALSDPAVLTDTPILPLAVDTSGGPAWGATVADRRVLHFAGREGSDQSRPAGFSDWRVALSADVERFRAGVRQLFGEGS
jgi:inosine-uridine nucleoside N-ribohydrolase